MGIDRRTKLNSLLSSWPDGVIHTTLWLHAQGYSDQNLQKYRASGWINSVGSGVYKKFDDAVDWYGGLQAIQQELRLPVHVGGKFALTLAGRAHYLNLGNPSIEIFGTKTQLLPLWFRNGPWEAKINYRRKNLFDQLDELFGKKSAGFSTKDEQRISFIISSAERAFFEYLDDTPIRASYDEALKLLEAMPDLRSSVLQSLLDSCNSIKVKRLFLHFADRASHPWFKKLKTRHVDLGKGKRVIFTNGKLDPKYLITIPRDADENRHL